MRAMQGAGGGASLPEPTQCGSDGGPAGSEGDDLEAVFNGLFPDSPQEQGGGDGQALMPRFRSIVFSSEKQVCPVQSPSQVLRSV